MIKLLKQTLVGTGVMLVTAVSLFFFATPVEDFLHNAFTTNNSNISTSKNKGNIRYKLVRCLIWEALRFKFDDSLSSNVFLNLRKEELPRLPIQVMDDDDLAAAAADGRPVYCRDRFYRALAGGQYCKWDDLIN